VIVHEIPRAYLGKVPEVLELLHDARARDTRKDSDVAERIQLQNFVSFCKKLSHSKARSSPSSNNITDMFTRESR
jgi:hypothetical protein